MNLGHEIVTGPTKTDSASTETASEWVPHADCHQWLLTVFLNSKIYSFLSNSWI